MILERYKLPYTASEFEKKIEKINEIKDSEKLINKISELTDISTEEQYPNAKAVINYTKKSCQELSENLSENLQNQIVQTDYSENYEGSRAYMKNRPFYYIEPKDITETFYSSSEGDPTATYIADDDNTRLICSPLATINGLEASFKENATINISLDISYGSSKNGTIKRSAIVKKYSDEIFYVGSWYWYEEDSTFTQDADFLIIYNITLGQLSIYLDKKIALATATTLQACSNKNVTLISNYTSEEILQQIDTKFIPDYISKTDMIAYVTEQLELLKKELQTATTD